MKETEIIASIGRWNTPKDLVHMINEGMRVARFNFSHGDTKKFSRILRNLREAEKITNKKIKVLGDTQGIEIRTINYILEPISVKEGDILSIKKEEDNSSFDGKSFSITHFKEVYDGINTGDHVLINDGILDFIVRKVENETIYIQSLNNGIIEHRKGVNIPNMYLIVPFLSEKDKEDIKFMVENDFDYIALSFVRSLADIETVQEYIDSIDPFYDRKIISKIECQRAINNIDEIIQESDGIMIARGDLGVEVPFWKVPYLQEKIFEKISPWNKLHEIRPEVFDKKEIIVATQMLESMTHSPKPTRAEVTDIWNAKRQGADYVMLSGETCAGDYPIEAIQTMKKILDYDGKELI